MQRPDRAADEIYHFLLPDPGMANYIDKVAKAALRRTISNGSRDGARRSASRLKTMRLSRLQQL